MWNPKDFRGEVFQQCALVGAHSSVKPLQLGGTYDSEWDGQRITHHSRVMDSEPPSHAKCDDTCSSCGLGAERINKGSRARSFDGSAKCTSGAYPHSQHGGQVGRTESVSTTFPTDEPSNGTRLESSSWEADVRHDMCDCHWESGRSRSKEDAAQLVIDAMIASRQLMVHNLQNHSAPEIRLTLDENILLLTNGTHEDGPLSMEAFTVNPVGGICVLFRFNNDLILHVDVASRKFFPSRRLKKFLARYTGENTHDLCRQAMERANS